MNAILDEHVPLVIAEDRGEIWAATLGSEVNLELPTAIADLLTVLTDSASHTARHCHDVFDVVALLRRVNDSPLAHMQLLGATRWA